jgi:hypothetical protein
MTTLAFLFSALLCVVCATVVAPLVKPTTCDVCQAITSAGHVLALYEDWNATVLSTKLQTVCTIIPSQYQAQCKLLVATFGAVECQCLTQPSASFNATECCTDVAFCTGAAIATATNSVLLAAAPVVAAKPRTSASAECSACKALANLAHLGARFANLNGTQVDQYLTDLCSYVPSEYESECQEVVSVGAQQIAACVADANQQFSAQACCAAISLCDAPTKSHMRALKKTTTK